MAFYTVLIPPPGSGGPREEMEQARLLPDGFSWTAFALNLAWLLGKRLWLASLLVALAYGGLIYAQSRHGLTSGGFLIAHWAISLFLGLEGHDLIARKLMRRGWRLAAVVEGRDLAEAERRYFAQALAGEIAPARQPAPARAQPAGPVPVIGLFPEARGR